MKFVLAIILVACLYVAGSATAEASSLSWKSGGLTNKFYQSIACTADGTTVYATSYYTTQITTNSCASWSVLPTPTNFSSLTCSADGTKLFAVKDDNEATNWAGLIYVSTNSGANWTMTNFYNVEITNYSIFSGLNISCSPDGSAAIALAMHDTSDSFDATTVELDGPFPCYVVVSTNAGMSWYNIPGDFDDVHSLAIVSGGRKLAIAEEYDVMTSTDGGATFSHTNFIGVNSVVSSADGGKLFVVNGYGDVRMHVSTNWGVTWSDMNTPTNAGGSLSVSGDGKTLVMIAGVASLVVPYVSFDSGVTWSDASNLASGYWNRTVISADGKKIYALNVFDTNSPPDPLATLQLAPSSLLNISSTLTNVTLSWIIPSTNMVLQKSSGPVPANWIDITNAPTASYLTLQNSVSLPPPNENRFYRLRSR